MRQKFDYDNIAWCERRKPVTLPKLRCLEDNAPPPPPPPKVMTAGDLLLAEKVAEGKIGFTLPAQVAQARRARILKAWQTRRTIGNVKIGAARSQVRVKGRGRARKVPNPIRRPQNVI